MNHPLRLGSAALRADGLGAEVVAAWDAAPITVAGAALLLPIALVDVWATSSLTHPISVLLAGGLALGFQLLLLLATRALVINRMVPGPPRRAAVLISYGLSGAVLATAAPALAASSSTGPPHVATAGLVPIAITSSVLWLTLTSVLVHQHRRSRATLAELTQQQTNLAGEQAGAVEALADTAAGLDAIRGQVASAVSSAQTQLVAAANPADLLSIADGLDATVRYMVRPTSHRLAKPAIAPTPTAQVPVGHSHNPARLVGEWARDLCDAQPFQPVAVGLVCIPIALASLPATAWNAAVDLPQIAGLCLQLGLLLLGAGVWDRCLGSLPRSARLVIIVAVYSGMGLIFVALARWFIPQGFSVHLEAAAFPPIAAALVGMASALDHRYRRMLAEMARLVEATNWSAAAVKQQLWAQRRELGVTMHGRVQASLTACAMLLRSWVSGGADPSRRDDVVNRVRGALQDAQLAIDQPSEPDFTALVADLTAIWADVLFIDLAVAPGVTAKLAGDPSASAAAGEILRELLLNAVRHGHAERADIVITEIPTNELLISFATVERGCADDSRSDAWRSPDPGIGHELLDLLATHWEVSQDGQRRTTTVALTVAA